MKIAGVRRPVRARRPVHRYGFDDDNLEETSDSKDKEEIAEESDSGTNDDEGSRPRNESEDGEHTEDDEIPEAILTWQFVDHETS